MGFLFWKKKKVEVVKNEVNTAVKVDKHTAQMNCMIIKSFTNEQGITEYTAKFSIGDRKFTFSGAVDTHKSNISSIDVGDVFVALYDPNNPSDAVIKDFQEL